MTGWDTLTIIDPMDFIPMTLLLFFSFLGDAKGEVPILLRQTSNMDSWMWDAAEVSWKLVALGICTSKQFFSDLGGPWRSRAAIVVCWILLWIPSGKHTKNDGTSPFLMGKSTINCHFQ